MGEVLDHYYECLRYATFLSGVIVFSQDPLDLKGAVRDEVLQIVPNRSSEHCVDQADVRSMDAETWEGV